MARFSSASPRCASWRGDKRPGAGHGGCGSPPRPQGSRCSAPRRLSPEQQAFAVSHLGLAQQQARRFAIRHGLAYEDLLGPAYEGLCKAALGFAPERGHRPSSYVVPKVKGELLHHLRDTGFALRISHRYRELWIKARRLLAQGRCDREIAQALEVPLGVWVDVRLACGVAPLPLERALEGMEIS